jgi:hypothetical protein
MNLSLHQAKVALGQDVRILTGLLRRVLVGALLSLALLAAVEELAEWLGRHSRAGSLVAPVPLSSYASLVSASVGAQATFLALFFTTVGVIASTAYAQVPGEVRQLFVRERASTIYVWNVVLALVFGIGLLTFPVVSTHEFRGLTVVVFAALTGVSIFSLVILGRSLFNFFDPSILSGRLYPTFLRSVRAASVTKHHIPDVVEQNAAHRLAASTLARYGQLVTLISGRQIQDASAPNRLAYQLLNCWIVSSAVKSSIPTASEWFARTPSHPNWLTMDHTQLTLALRTRTGVQPSLAPDPLWVERRLASLIGKLLPVLSTNDEWVRVVATLDSINDVVFALAKRLQVDEAFLLLRAVASYRNESSAGRESAEADAQMFQLALGEREVLGFTKLWLGVVAGSEGFEAPLLAESLDDAVEQVTAPYKVGAPRELLRLLEDVASGIAFERRTEGARITPPWWVHHMSARHLSKVLVNAVDAVVSAVERSLVAPLARTPPTDPELGALRIFDLLELIRKISMHLPRVRNTLASLRTLQHERSADELWPSYASPNDRLAAMEEVLLTLLGGVALQLPYTSHDSSRPDLFGQAYRQLFDATFHAILDGHSTMACALFPGTWLAHFRAASGSAEDRGNPRPSSEIARSARGSTTEGPPFGIKVVWAEEVDPGVVEL